MPAHQLTNSPLDRIALVHSKLKFRALLLASPLLERFVVGPHNNRAVGLILSNASGPIRAVMTLAAKLKTVADFAALLLSRFATVGAGLSAGQTALRSVMLISKASIRYSFARSLRAALG